MTREEFRNLQHGDKIHHGGRNYIVHNNWRCEGIVVVVRTEVIRDCNCGDWKPAKKYEPVNLVTSAGTYEVQIVRRL